MRRVAPPSTPSTPFACPTRRAMLRLLGGMTTAGGALAAACGIGTPGGSDAGGSKISGPKEITWSCYLPCQCC